MATMPEKLFQLEFVVKTLTRCGRPVDDGGCGTTVCIRFLDHTEQTVCEIPGDREDGENDATTVASVNRGQTYTFVLPAGNVDRCDPKPVRVAVRLYRTGSSSSDRKPLATGELNVVPSTGTDVGRCQPSSDDDDDDELTVPLTDCEDDRTVGVLTVRARVRSVGSVVAVPVPDSRRQVAGCGGLSTVSDFSSLSAVTGCGGLSKSTGCGGLPKATGCGGLPKATGCGGPLTAIARRSPCDTDCPKKPTATRCTTTVTTPPSPGCCKPPGTTCCTAAPKPLVTTCCTAAPKPLATMCCTAAPKPLATMCCTAAPKPPTTMCCTTDPKPPAMTCCSAAPKSPMTACCTSVPQPPATTCCTTTQKLLGTSCCAVAQKTPAVTCCNRTPRNCRRQCGTCSTSDRHKANAAAHREIQRQYTSMACELDGRKIDVRMRKKNCESCAVERRITSEAEDFAARVLAVVKDMHSLVVDSVAAKNV